MLNRFSGNHSVGWLSCSCTETNTNAFLMNLTGKFNLSKHSLITLMCLYGIHCNYGCPQVPEYSEMTAMIDVKTFFSEFSNSKPFFIVKFWQYISILWSWLKFEQRWYTDTMIHDDFQSVAVMSVRSFAEHYNAIYASFAVYLYALLLFALLIRCNYVLLALYYAQWQSWI